MYAHATKRFVALVFLNLGLSALPAYPAELSGGVSLFSIGETVPGAWIYSPVGYDNGDITTIAPAGDFNGDGCADFVLGAARTSLSGGGGVWEDIGAAHVIYGGTGWNAPMGAIDLDYHPSASSGVTFFGDQPWDWAGQSVNTAGDVNGDGVDDLLIGAQYAQPDGTIEAGRTYLVYGKSGTKEHAGYYDLAEVGTSSLPGAVFNGTEDYQYSGYRVSPAGDINQDGRDDLMVVARNDTYSGVYETYLVYGQSGAGELNGSIDLSQIGSTLSGAIFRDDLSESAGQSALGAGDFNGDGVGDIILGAPDAPDNGTSSGKAYVIYGQAGATPFSGQIDLSTVGGATAGAVFRGTQTGALTGWDVSSAGDVDADGTVDLLISAPGEDVSTTTDAGRVYLVYGQSGAEQHSGLLELSDVGTVIDGAVINGIAQDDLIGQSVSGGGDVNGDGLADILVTSGDASGQATYNDSNLIYGAAGYDRLTGEIDLAYVGGSVAGAYFPRAVGSNYSLSGNEMTQCVGDVNNDGLDDFLMMGTLESGGELAMAYLVYGQDATSYPQDFLVRTIGGEGEMDILSLGNGDKPIYAGELVVESDGLFQLYAGGGFSASTMTVRGTYIDHGGTASVHSLVMEGGSATMEYLPGWCTVTLNSGTLRLTKQEATMISAGTQLGNNLQLVSGVTLQADYGVVIDADASAELFGGNLETDILLIDAGGAFAMNGGTLRVNELRVDPDSQFQFDSGELAFTGDLMGDNSIALSRVLGASPSIGSGRQLSVSGLFDVHTVIELDGGAVTAGELLNGHRLNLDSGTLTLTEQGLSVGSAGTLSEGDLVLGSDTTIRLENGHGVDVATDGRMVLQGGRVNASGTVVNHGQVTLDESAGYAGRLDAATLENYGLIDGRGRIEATLCNHGEVRSEASQLIRFGLGDHANHANLNFLDGDVEFDGQLTNEAGGMIEGRNGTLRFDGGLRNEGGLRFSFGTSDVFGAVENAAGAQVILSGAGDATFYGDVTNSGEVRASAGSEAVFFGTLWHKPGSSFSGDGTLYVEGEEKTGDSPGWAIFDIDRVYGAGSEVELELAGTTRFTGPDSPDGEYDVYGTTKELTLNNPVLNVVLIDGFQPSAGDAFDVLDWGSLLSGADVETDFTDAELPFHLAWNTDDLLLDGTLRVEQLYREGDTDGDFDVDATDLASLGLKWDPVGDGNGWADGDFDGDGDVDATDLATLGQNWNPLGYSPIPEPATLSLLGIGALGLLRRKTK